MKFLTKKIETKLAKRIVNSVEVLVNDPYPMNSRKLKGTYRNVDHAHAYCRISSHLQSMSVQGYSSLGAM